MYISLLGLVAVVAVVALAAFLIGRSAARDERLQGGLSARNSGRVPPPRSSSRFGSTGPEAVEEADRSGISVVRTSRTARVTDKAGLAALGIDLDRLLSGDVPGVQVTNEVVVSGGQSLSEERQREVVEKVRRTLGEEAAGQVERALKARSASRSDRE